MKWWSGDSDYYYSFALCIGTSVVCDEDAVTDLPAAGNDEVDVGSSSAVVD